MADWSHLSSRYSLFAVNPLRILLTVAALVVTADVQASAEGRSSFSSSPTPNGGQPAVCVTRSAIPPPSGAVFLHRFLSVEYSIPQWAARQPATQNRTTTR
jgi:hypothetical protein